MAVVGGLSDKMQLSPLLLASSHFDGLTVAIANASTREKQNQQQPVATVGGIS